MSKTKANQRPELMTQVQNRMNKADTIGQMFDILSDVYDLKTAKVGIITKTIIVNNIVTAIRTINPDVKND